MVTTTSMPFPALEPTSCPTAAASSLQTSRSSADAEARHLAAAVARGDEAAFRLVTGTHDTKELNSFVFLFFGVQTQINRAENDNAFDRQ
jgi:hypothetical protein